MGMTAPLFVPPSVAAGAAQRPLGRHEPLCSLRDALELFLRSRSLAPLSRQLYRRAILRFLEWFKGQNLHPAAVGVAYREHLEASYPSKNRTTATYIAPVRQFFKFLRSQGVVTTDPFEAVRVKVFSNSYERPVLTEAEAAELLASLDGDGLVLSRDRALIALLLHTGLRIAEAVSLSAEDIVKRDGVPILMVKGKGRTAKDEYVVLVPAVLDALAGYLTATGRSLETAGPLFLAHNHGEHGSRLSKIGAQKAIARRLAAVGLKRAGLAAHSLRHTAATTALRHGATPFAVSKMLRHRSLASTQVYLHDLERLTDGAEFRVTYCNLATKPPNEDKGRFSRSHP